MSLQDLLVSHVINHVYQHLVVQLDRVRFTEDELRAHCLLLLECFVLHDNATVLLRVESFEHVLVVQQGVELE
jgi:hypothetical protein